MARSPVELSIAGAKYRVVSTASEPELHRLAGLVDERIAALTPRGRSASPQAMLLAAMAFAHDAEATSTAQSASRSQVEERMRSYLARIDSIVEQLDSTLHALELQATTEPNTRCTEA
jgi:cell division protein ZapA